MYFQPSQVVTLKNNPFIRSNDTCSQQSLYIYCRVILIYLSNQFLSFFFHLFFATACIPKTTVRNCQLSSLSVSPLSKVLIKIYLETLFSFIFFINAITLSQLMSSTFTNHPFMSYYY